jgi:predicted TIM-barrel fold metal-dependent hydrolase
LSVGAIIRDELAALGGEQIQPFDVHSHTGADVDGSTRTAEEQVRAIEQLGGRSVIFPFCVTNGYEVENRRVIEEGGRHPDRLIPFARLDPRISGAADASAALGAGARGFKLHPRSEAFPLDHPNVDAIFGVAGDAGVPTLIHAGAGVGSFGATIVDLAERHRGCPIVLAHAGISDLAWLWRELPDHPNLFFDTAWLVPADLLALFALVPPGRILYGSDAPFMDIELLLAVTLRCARFTGLSENAIALMVGGQLERLLAGEAPADAGPAPGAPGIALSPADSRMVSLLSAAGGCMLGGGDPDRSLELALLASADDPAGAGSQGMLTELIEEARSGSEQAVSALVLALTLAMTPRGYRAAAIA